MGSFADSAFPTDWSGRRESNPRHKLGRLLLYHWATPALITAFSATICCSPLKWWRGLDSNQRRRKPTDLQSAPFNHSGTPPRQTDNYRYRSFHCQGFVSVPFKNEKQHAVILSVAPLILQWPFHDRPSFYFGPRLSGRKCAASAALGTRSARKSGIGRGSRATRIQTLENFLPPVFSAYFRIDGLVSDCVFKRQSAGARRACSAHRTGWGNRSGSANQR